MSQVKDSNQVSGKSFVKGASGLDRCEKSYMRGTLRKSTLGLRGWYRTLRDSQ